MATFFIVNLKLIYTKLHYLLICFVLLRYSVRNNFLKFSFEIDEEMKITNNYTKQYTKEQLKKLEERILVEESDISLSMELFQKEDPKNIVQNKYNNEPIQKNINKKMEKQKKNNESSKMIKEHKMFKKQTEKINIQNINHKKHDDIYDNSFFCDDYLDYEDKYS